MDNNASKMMITALAWVKRGYAKAVTDQYEGNDIEEIKKEQADHADIYGLEDYDNEDNMPDLGEDIVAHEPEDDGEGDEDMIPNEDYPQMVADDQSDDQDFIQKTDALIVTASAEKDYSNLEVYVFEENVSNLYVHHEIMLNTYPLCLEWIPYVPGSNASFSEKGNYIAVGTFTPAIEIWNLDIVDVVEPFITLGGETEAGKSMPLKSMKTKKKKMYFNEGSHLDAVLSLSIHPTEVNFLASGSADKVVKIWDLSTQKCVRDIKNHTDRVQVLQWNPNDPASILSGGFDGKAVVTNSKNPNEKIYLKYGNTEIEAGCWNPLDQYCCYFSFENGEVKGYDVRNPEKPLFDFTAHEQQCTDLTVCKANKNLLATSSVDGRVNVWDMSVIEDNKPLLIQSKDLKVGGLFTCKFYDDSPWILAAGGIKGQLGVWDLEESEYVVKNFQGTEAYDKLKQQEKELGIEGRKSPEPVDDDEEDDSDHMDDEKEMAAEDEGEEEA